MKKLFYTFLIIVLLPLSVFGKDIPHATVIHAPQSVAQQQQFYVDIVVDTKGVSINGVQGAVTFSSDTLSFVRAETGTSNITLWIDQPVVKGNSVIFSGIIPGGFDGLINPFDQSAKLPAEIVRLVFVGKSAGVAAISTTNITVTDTDGKGTVEKLSDTSTTFPITTSVAPSVYTTPDTIAPTLSVSIVNDKNLYDGHAVLVFTATDKESGIDHVTLQEGDNDLSTIESPYLLHDQSRKSILLLHAYDVAGNVATITIAPLSSQTSTTVIVILILITLIILYVNYKKTRHNKNSV